jgi:Skp family chaperone for outer membrane proteins
MKLRVNAAAAAILAVSLVTAYAQTSGTTPKAKKQTTTKKETMPPPPSVTEQINALRQEMQSQIDALKSSLADKDAQLRQAQQTATDAQAAATKAEADSMAQQQAFTQNTAAVATLQSTVTDLKANETSLATTVSDQVTAVKKAFDSPDALHYKGITLAPGGFLAGETVWRSKATGGDIPTAFSSIPYEGADAYSLSEFFGSARQSRITMMAQGKTKWGTLRGYYEADFLGTGITSNNNQSNSYVLRQRVLWAQAALNNGWAFTGGQLWSLAAEDKKGISNISGDILTPLTIDPNYVPGFVWTRQYGFRVTKTMNKVAFGVAAENPQLLYTASIAGNTPYAVLGSAGQNGGNYNAAVSTVASTTYIQNYENLALGTTSNIAVPVYNTVTANTNIANLSFNYAPDIIVKAALDPGWGHYEVFGIAGFAHETVYPGETTNSLLYGGADINKVNIVDIETGAVIAPKASSASSYANSIVLGGVGGSLRVPLIKDKLNFGVKGLYGPGMGRYGNSTLADVTADAHGKLAPIHNASGLFTLEATPTPRLTIYANYGGDYAGRTDFGSAATTSLGAPTAVFCTTPGTAATCTATPTAAQLSTVGGAWGAHWGAPSAKPVGYGSREAVNSGCDTPIANPGYNGSSTGYYAGSPSSSTCTGQTRNVQEVTAGYWYDFYKGDKGRLRQSIQYGYAVREGWSGASGYGAKGIDNMFWTSFRYYLP